MITRLAVAGYRSIRDLVLELGPLTVVTGANGSGKSSLYRALRLLADIAQGRLIASLALEGGLPSALWAGPEQISARMKRGEIPVQGTVRSGPVSLRLGFGSAEYGYAVDLGQPIPGHPFPLDPEIKREAVWTGEALGRANLFADRRGPAVRIRRLKDGTWRELSDMMPSHDSMITRHADPDDGRDLLLLRERMRNWRFYDSLRTDRDAPARRAHVTTFTPILAADGADLGAAIATVQAIGDAEAFARAVDDAFPGARVQVRRGEQAVLAMQQPGLLRPLSAAELSDGTLRYLLLIAALLSPRPPELMVLNEPEASLHPSLLAPLARLLSEAAHTTQIVVISHSDRLVAALGEDERTTQVLLDKELGETVASGNRPPGWTWPTR